VKCPVQLGFDYFILPNIILFIINDEDTFLKYIGLLMPFLSTYA